MKGNGTNIGEKILLQNRAISPHFPLSFVSCFMLHNVLCLVLRMFTFMFHASQCFRMLYVALQCCNLRSNVSISTSTLRNAFSSRILILKSSSRLCVSSEQKRSVLEYLCVIKDFKLPSEDFVFISMITHERKEG